MRRQNPASERAHRARARAAVVIAMAIGGVAVQGARADVITDWNATVLNATPMLGGPFHARALSYVHVAMADAVNAVDRRYTAQLVEMQAPAGASVEAAAAAAAHGVLRRLFPTQSATFDAALVASLAAVPDGPGEQAGVATGQAVAEKVYAVAMTDGADGKGNYVPGTKPSSWRPTVPGFSARLAQWGDVRPFVIKTRDQFPLPGPPPIDSQLYADEINEVEELGSINSTKRTGEQTAIAIYWQTSASVPLNAAARASSAKANYDLHQNARLFALLNMATHDACIAVWGAKYDYDLLRPETAIREAPSLRNPAIRHVADWEPLMVPPAFGDYPSGHSGVVGSGVAALQAIFGHDETEVRVTYPNPPTGVVRRWTSFSAMADEIIEARIWAGAHIRTANVDAVKLGREIAEYTVANAMRPVQP